MSSCCQITRITLSASLLCCFMWRAGVSRGISGDRGGLNDGDPLTLSVIVPDKSSYLVPWSRAVSSMIPLSRWRRCVRSRAAFPLQLIERLLKRHAASGRPRGGERLLAQGRTQGGEITLILRLVDRPARRAQRLTLRLRHSPQPYGVPRAPLQVGHLRQPF